MGRQEHLSNWCLEGVTLPPFGLRCRCFNWCNSHQLTLVIGETPKLKRISFGSTKIHKLLHLLLIKCYHMLPLKFRTIRAIPFVVPFPSSPHLSWLPVFEAPNIAMAAFASSNKASNAALSPSTFNGELLTKILGVESRFSNKNHHWLQKYRFFRPEDSWLSIIYTYQQPQPPEQQLAEDCTPPNIAVLQSYFSILWYFIQFPSVLSPKSSGHVVPVSSLARPDMGPVLTCWQQTGSSILNLQKTWLPKTEQCPCFNLWFLPLKRRVS